MPKKLRKKVRKELVLNKIQDVWKAARNAFIVGKKVEPRPGQIQMMDMIEEALLRAQNKSPSDPNPVIVAQAPTGTGKTYGYLVPSMPFARYENTKVIVATANKALQRQIFDKDIPEMKVMLPGCAELIVSMPKGKSNFVCLEKIEAYSIAIQDENKEKNEKAQSIAERKKKKNEKKTIPIIAQLNDIQKKEILEMKEDLLRDPSDNLKWFGDFDELNVSDKEKEDRKILIGADRHSCLKQSCDNYAKCIYYKKKNVWQNSDLLIANHDWVLNSLAVESPMIKPENTILIFDEAHHLPDKAIRAFQVMMTEEILTRMADWSKFGSELYHSDMADIKSKIAEFSTLSSIFLSSRIEIDDKEFQDAWNQSIVDLSFACKDTLARFAVSQKGTANSVILHDQFLQDPNEKFNQSLKSLKVLTQQMLDEMSKITTILEDIFAMPKFLKLNSKERNPLFKWRSSWMRKGEQVREWMDVMNKFLMTSIIDIDHSPISKSVRWTQSGNWRIEVSHTFADRLLPLYVFKKAKATVLTSATLTTVPGNSNQDEFSLYARRSGINQLEDVKKASLPSPFDFSKSICVEIETESDPADRAQFFNYEREIYHLVPKTVLDADLKGNLLLFTSIDLMQKAMENFPKAFREMCKFQKTGNLDTLIAQHKADVDAGKMSVLVGVQSLAEGLDLPGKWCQHVVITKLPFEPPGNPVKELLKDWYEKYVRKNGFFQDIVIPETGIVLEQQIGRLVRTSSDYGIITIFDSRVYQKFPLFQKLIPKGFQRVRIAAEDIKIGGYKEIRKKLEGQEYDKSFFIHEK